MTVGPYVICYSSMGKQWSFEDMISPFVTPRAKGFQDNLLDEVAGKLNAAIDEARKDNKDENRQLTFILTKKGIVVAWENTGELVVNEEDNTEDELLAALGV
jgi:hypothetical protein